MTKGLTLLAIIAALVITGRATHAADSDAPKDAQPATQKANAAVLKELNFADSEDFEDAQRGLIAALPKSVIKAVDGHRPGVVLCNQRLEERRRGGSQMVP